MPYRLFDTNIPSFELKQHPLAAEYRPFLVGYDRALSFMTVGELREWSEDARWGASKRSRLEKLIAGSLVLHSTDLVCYHWSVVRTSRRDRRIGESDAWVAATALAYGLDLVTHNPADFADIPGLRVLSVLHP